MTQHSKEFLNNLRDYNNLVKEVNEELENKKRFLFPQRDFAINWCQEVREKLDKINSLYTNLTSEMDDEKPINKKRIKKLTEIRYRDRNVEIRIPTYF